jgi:predicted nucleic acid-binding protein
VDGSLGRLGQVRSPFHIEIQDDFERHDRKMGLGIDGEFYELRLAKQITFTIDKECPKIKILKRQGFVNPSEKNQQILTELKNDF